MFIRELALARVRAAAITNKSHEGFMRAAEYAKAHVDSWQTSDKRQRTKITALKRDLRQIIKHALKRRESAGHWDDFYLWGEKNLSAEGREMLLSLLLEPHGHLVDELADTWRLTKMRSFAFPALLPSGKRGWRWRKITLGRLPLIFRWRRKTPDFGMFPPTKWSRAWANAARKRA